MELESNHHSVFLLYYHLVLVVKYRRKVFDDIVSARAREIFEYIAPKYGITVEEWNHDMDHVHVLFRAPAEERVEQVHQRLQERVESSAQAGVSADSAETVEGVFLEPQLLPTDHRRRANRSHPQIYREPRQEVRR